MRTILSLLFLLLPIQALATIDYQLDVQLIPDQQSLQATARIIPDNSIPETARFFLSENCKILSIQQAGQDLSYEFTGGELSITQRNRQPISIRYRGYFADQVSSTPIHNEDPSYGVSATISTKGTFLSSAANWYPRIKAEDIRYQLKVSAPAGTEAISSGQRISRQNDREKATSSWEIDYPLYGLTLSAGPYQVFENLDGRIPIYAYFYADSAQFAALYLRAARKYMDLYEQLFGPYPFHKFAVVENFFPTGYGLPSWTLLGSSVIRLPFIVKTSLGHEMAHSWWGTGVRVDYSQGNWSEGLTTYVADYLYKEQTSASEALEYRLKILRDYATLVDAESEFPLSQFSSRQDRASQSIGYGKAAMLFHMLRKEVGEEIFWSTLKTIAEEKLFQPIGWNELKKYFSAASGINLNSFFTQWLQRTRGPELALQQLRIEKTDNGYITHGVIVQTDQPYGLTIELELETETGITSNEISLSGTKQEFSLRTDTRPLAITADPNSNLFRILSEQEIPETVNSLRGSKNLLVIKAENFTPSDNAGKTLLGALRKSNLDLKSLDELSDAERKENDLLFFGADKLLKPEALTGNSLQLADKITTLTGKSAFLVQANPYNEAYVISWFLSAENPKDDVVARKIPHYGKYSYLLFDAADNRLKGTFPPATSPLRVMLED